MPACYIIRFADTGEETEWFGLRGYYYEFGDGSTLDLRPTMAWCVKCQDFVDAEWIASLQQIEDELVELRDPTSMRAEVFTSEEPPFDKPVFRERRKRLYAEAIDEAERRVQWRSDRLAPPKCLQCGSTNVEFQGDGNEMTVTGRGLVHVECTGMCSTDFLNWFFTPEGDRIPRETKPSYWHLPGEET
ncbi:hypothetical protein [Stieleria varia]|uniref:Uncharacterized protein n=1 Tax=Stieleria varia TaxID=2528005 RepID=A0A5C6B1S8_9BACT|nr:hypothetical protein [Stieleria varia]TWU05850.1 hypothetical protein Pla52n_15650 [Stieleria varia]